jgi:ankyrin repeat protein
MAKAADVAKLLMQKGADVNAKDKDGRTPADVARMANAREVEMIIRMGGRFR